MTVEQHRFPTGQLTALAQGQGGVTAVRRLAAARLSKTSLLIRHILKTTGHTAHEHEDIVRQSYSALVKVQRRAPGAVRTVLEYPSVGAWALRCALSLDERADKAIARPADLAVIAAAAAIRGSVPITLSIVPQQDSMVRLPSLGTASFPATAGDVILRSFSDHATLEANGTVVAIPPDPHVDGPNWRGIRRISCRDHDRRLDLFLDGQIPRTLPAELRPVPSLANPCEVELWTEKLTAGWQLLTRDHTAAADEVAAAIRVIAPLSHRLAEPASATLGDAFGAIVMSLPNDGPLTAVTLVHETRHALLTGLMDLLPLVDSTSDALFYAPWREDPRPPVGLLHGLYAHMGIASFWRRQREATTPGKDRTAHADVQFARWSTACREAAHTLLTSGLLTPPGRMFVLAMNQQLDQWRSDVLPPRAISIARTEAEEHRARWLKRAVSAAPSCGIQQIR